MSDVTLIDSIALAEIDNTPFLSRCRQRQASAAELREFVKQQYYYSRYFTRYLCALLSNISDERDRLELTENLLEEIGFGHDGHAGSLPHSQIYRNMMQKMDIDPAQGEASPATRHLIEAMFEACKNPDPLIGLGALCLGAEAIVPHLYTQIVEGFRGIGVPDEQLEFFLIHIHCDDGHAITMKKIIERQLAGHPEDVAVLKRAARRVWQARARFFLAIPREEAKRHESLYV
jgi:pyrroloquinoline quinone (PQQ) biosynthesis protein C